MHKTVVRSRVGGDGVLHLELPLGADEANREVQVTVEALARPMPPAEWRAWVLSMAGSIEDPTFERPPQPLLEEREPLP